MVVLCVENPDVWGGLPEYGSVPMVAVTGYSMFDDRSRSLNAGFNEHVTKPIDPRAFLDLIEQL